MLVIHAPRVVADSVPLGPACVAVQDGLVVGVVAGDTYGGRRPDVELPSGVLAPGLVDIQINGCFGVDFVAADPAEWAEVTRRLPETGVTAFQPTFITAPVADLVAALRRTAALPADLPGARIVGVHVEGPFLAGDRHGAHDPELLCDPDPAAIEALLAAAPGLFRMHTLAPERSGGMAAVRRLAEAGVLVSIGHSDVTAAQAEEAADAGARAVTHLFNAMRPLHHREPGLVGQALADPRLTSGLIADLHHVAAPVCRIAFAAAPGRIVLVTDAVAAAGMPPGTYDLGGQQLSVDPLGLPRRSDGTIAGSGLRLDAAVANVVAAGVDLRSAVDAATRLPADLVGRPDLGRIAPGAVADLVWLGDDLTARATWLGGTLAHGRLPAAARDTATPGRPPVAPVHGGDGAGHAAPVPGAFPAGVAPTSAPAHLDGAPALAGAPTDGSAARVASAPAHAGSVLDGSAAPAGALAASAPAHAATGLDGSAGSEPAHADPAPFHAGPAPAHAGPRLDGAAIGVAAFAGAPADGSPAAGPLDGAAPTSALAGLGLDGVGGSMEHDGVGLDGIGPPVVHDGVGPPGVQDGVGLDGVGPPVVHDGVGPPVIHDGVGVDGIGPPGAHDGIALDGAAPARPRGRS